MTTNDSRSLIEEIGRHFEHHLEEFRKEVQGGTQFFYAMLAINAMGANEHVLTRLNDAPLFWKTNIAALQTAFFVTLGRVFDQKSAYNIDALVRLAQNNICLFSKSALAERKRRQSSNADEWLPQYLRDAYEPSLSDFRCMRKYVKKYRALYEKNYDPIRDRIYAHKELARQSDKHSLFSQTRILELQKLFGFLNQLYTILWELYFNGNAPRFRRIPYSVTRMLREERSRHRARTVQENIVDEVRQYLSPQVLL
jgi:AbiU2